MASPASATILIVDDDEAKRYSIAKILRKAGFAIWEVETGTEALRRAVEKPDLIILDVKLPDISGFEVCQRIKADPTTAAIPVLHLSTTFVDLEDKVHGLEGGADGYLTDALEPLELIATVRALLRARKAEEAVRISSRQWQVTFDAISDGVLLLDREGRVIQVNQAGERILGRPWGDLIGPTVQEVLAPMTGELASPFDRMLRSMGREAVDIPAGDRWLQVAFDPIRGTDGLFKGALCILSDITARRRLEEEQRRRADELRAADRRKDEFLAMLAHELRNPLAPIRNALENIRLEGAGGAVIQEALEIAGRQVGHMARMLDDLLDVARFTSGQVRLRKTPVDLRLIVSNSVETARPLIEAGRHEFLLTLPAEPICLEADPTRLGQIVANLLNNAAKYTEAGGRIALTLQHSGDQAVLRVQDNGIGLSADMLPRVFDLFAQADQSLDRAQGGLGIGLTLVRSLVELHGGTIQVHSAGAGKGCEFVVRLPMPARPITLEPFNPRSTPPPPFHPLRILVIDDHVDSARSLAKVLVAWGYKAQVAHDGPSSLEVASANPPDVVLLDIGLPGMDGYEVANRFRNKSKNASPVLVALTGYGKEEDQRRSRDAGFDYHLVKPVDLGDLRSLLADPQVIAARDPAIIDS